MYQVWQWHLIWCPIASAISEIQEHGLTVVEKDLDS